MSKKKLLADKRLLKTKEITVISLSATLIKMADKTSLEYFNVIKTIEQNINEIKGIRASLYRESGVSKNE